MGSADFPATGATAFQVPVCDQADELEHHEKAHSGAHS